MHSFTIVGYTFAAVRDIAGDVEAKLDYIADMTGIDRADETTFDSGGFPRVVFLSDLDGDDRCGRCGRAMMED